MRPVLMTRWHRVECDEGGASVARLRQRQREWAGLAVCLRVEVLGRVEEGTAAKLEDLRPGRGGRQR